jgi:hypothetical protein
MRCPSPCLRFPEEYACISATRSNGNSFYSGTHVQGVWVRSTFFYAVGASCPRMVAAEGVRDHHGRLEEPEYLMARCPVSSHLPRSAAPVVQCRAFWRRSISAVVSYTVL